MVGTPFLLVPSARRGVLQWTPLGLGLGVTAALIWAQFRGFDMLDAATHFLTYQYPADNPDTHTHYARVAQPFWLLVGGNIVAFRLLTLALVSVTALVFWRLGRSLFSATEDQAWTGLALWLSALGGLAWLPVLLGYNSLSTVFSLMAMTALVWALTPAAPVGLRRSLGLLAFLGATAAAAMVKPPAALALAAWGGFLCLVLLPLPIWLRRTFVGLIAASLAAGLVWVFHFVSSADFDVTHLRNVAGLHFSPAWIVDTLDRYGREIANLLPALSCDVLWILVPALALAGVVAAGPGKAQLARATLILLMVLVTVMTIVRGLWDGSFTRAVSGEMVRLYLALWVAWLPAWAVCLVTGRGRGHPAAAPLIVACFFLPLSGGFGSTNTLYFSALHWTVFWTAGLLMLSRTVTLALGLPHWHRLTIVLLTVAAGAHLFSGHFLRPYMHQPALWRQNVPIALGHPATTLKLDTAGARFFMEVRGTLDRHGFQPGDDVFGFFNLPGVVFAVGGRQPGAPWYFGTWYHGDDTDGGKLRQVALERRQHAWIVTQADVSQFRQQFLEAGIDFPDGYVKIGKTTNPATGLEIGIWKPKSRP